jgi:hypothetical protein
LSNNFAKTNAALERLAKEKVKEKKKKEKLINNCSRLRLLARHLKKRIRGLKQKLKQRPHPDLQVLTQVEVNMQGEKSDVNGFRFEINFEGKSSFLCISGLSTAPGYYFVTR